MITFEELNLSDPVIRGVYNAGFETATDIQEQAIPPAMQRKDIIGQAQTGTGKTAAFGIPMLEKFKNEKGEVKGLIVAPTRELAVQVAEEINTIGQNAGVRALPVYGGQDINRQIKYLKRCPQIIVGTPGRLMDHMRRKTIRLDGVEIAVLDEADEMLNMGFIEDIENIMSKIPEERQVLLFSATIPEPIQELARRFMDHPKVIKSKSKEVTVSNTEQSYIEVPEKHKFDVFCRVLDLQSPELAIVFGRTKRRVDELNEALNKRGYSAEGIHGDLTQSRRDTVMRNFRESNTEILVATDVAARGLDIGEVSHVYNFDIPQDPDSYVHRIGRTGRLGKPGTALTLVTPREVTHLKTIEKSIKKKLKRQPAPTPGEVMEEQHRMVAEKIRQAVSQGDTSACRESAEALLEENDSVTLLSAAIKIMSREPDASQVKLSSEPSMVKSKKSHGKDHRSGSGSSWKKHKSNNKGDRKHQGGYRSRNK